MSEIYQPKEVVSELPTPEEVSGADCIHASFICSICRFPDVHFFHSGGARFVIQVKPCPIRQFIARRRFSTRGFVMTGLTACSSPKPARFLRDRRPDRKYSLRDHRDRRSGPRGCRSRWTLLSQKTAARLAGSSLRGSFLKVGGIYAGFSMEILAGGMQHRDHARAVHSCSFMNAPRLKWKAADGRSQEYLVAAPEDRNRARAGAPISCCPACMYPDATPNSLRAGALRTSGSRELVRHLRQR